jgi:phosphohistidine phosphatase
MPKHLYLLRHGTSAEKQTGQTDKERLLTPQGTRETLLIGQYLLKHKLVPGLIVSSTADRAATTAGFIADAMKIDHDLVVLEEELFQASTRTFLELINQLDDAHTHVMCVGHNPTISYLAEYLTKAEIGDMVPAGLAIIRFNCTSWKDASPEKGELVNYINPQMLVND